MAFLLHRLVGRNLRLSRADPPLHSGQPSNAPPLLLSPPGLATRRGPQTKTRSRGTDSPLTNPFPAPCCAGYERRFSAKKPSVLHADGLNKVSQMHLPPPNLPRFGGGERPPFSCKPPAPLTITMGLRLTVFASPNTPRASLSVPTCPPIRAPFPHRERGWGERADTPVATLGAYLCAVRIEFRFPPQINPYPAQPATGVLGQSPKRILPTFVRTKVGPRRAGVQTKFSKNLAPPEVIANFFTPPPKASAKPTPAGQAY